MNKALCCYFFFVFLITNTSSPSFAQDLEKLYQHYNQLPKGAETYYYARIPILDSIVEREIHKDPLAALPLLDTLAFLYQATGQEELYYRTIYRNKGFLYAISENKLKALEAYQNYAQVCKKSSLDDAYFLIDVGNLYYDFSLYNVARNYYKDAEKIFEQKNYYRGLGTIYSNYSLIAQHLNELDTALFFIQKTLNLQESFVKDTLQIAHSYQVLGRFYSKYKKDYPKAIPNYLKSIAIFSDERRKKDYRYNQFIVYLPRAYASLGQSYCQIGQVDTGLYYLREAVKEARLLGQDHAFTAVGEQVGKELFLQGYFQEAEQLLLEVEKVAIQNSNHTDLESCYHSLKDVYIQKKDFQKALAYSQKLEELRNLLKGQQDQFFLINDQLLQQEKNKRIAEQEQIIVAEQQLKFRLYGILGLIVLILGLMLFFWWKLNHKNQKIKSYAQKLERSNAIKEMLLAVIGHDLRTPFNVISTNIGLLFQKLKKQDYASLEQAVQEVDLSSRKAYVIMSELMQWTALQKKELVFVQAEVVELEKLIDKTIQQLDAFVETSCLIFEKEIDAIELIIDVNLFQIVLRNLLTNASKNTPYGGQVKLKTKKNEEGVALQIEDAGMGIPPELLDQLFAEVDALQVAQKGSGLGLKLVKSLCMELSIDIRAFNSLNGGAVFELQIPWECIRHFDASNHPKQSRHLSIEKTIKTEDYQCLLPYINQLLAYEVFESTAIRTILNQLKEEDCSPSILWWIAQLERVITINDNIAYKHFLQNGMIEKEDEQQT